MNLIKLALSLLASGAIVIAPGTHAAPTMFVKEARTGTWESDLVLVPTATQDAGITVEAINAFLQARLSTRAVESPAQSFTPICLMNFARVQDVTSSDRKAQNEIRTDLEAYPKSFSETWISGNENFTIRVGLFEDCKDDDQPEKSPTTYMALVITDSANKVREFDALDWNFIRLFKRSDGIINVLGCFACGEVRELRYNAADKEFYFKCIGH